MSPDELMFYNSFPSLLPIYAVLRKKLAELYPDVAVKVSKTQISFKGRYIFAIVSLPLRRIPGRPGIYLMVSFGLSYKKASPRIAQAAEAYPNRWTHHVPVAETDDIDAELLGWLNEAHNFSEIK